MKEKHLYWLFIGAWVVFFLLILAYPVYPMDFPDISQCEQYGPVQNIAALETAFFVYDCNGDGKADHAIGYPSVVIGDYGQGRVQVVLDKGKPPTYYWVDANDDGQPDKCEFFYDEARDGWNGNEVSLERKAVWNST